jgi:hypothetical protein
MNKKLISKLEGMQRREIEYEIDQRVICFRNAERNREIFKRALIDGVPQEKLAEDYGLETRQIQNIIYDIEKMLIQKL